MTEHINITGLVEMWLCMLSVYLVPPHTSETSSCTCVSWSAGHSLVSYDMVSTSYT